MRVLLAAFGTRGDVQPMVALGARLLGAGHEVVVGAAPGFSTGVREHGLEFHPIGLDIEAWLRVNGDWVRDPARRVRSIVRYLREDTRLALDQTADAARGSDLIVSGAHAAAASVAERMGVPHRVLAFCPQLIRSRFHPPPGVTRFALPQGCNRVLWWGALRGFEFVYRGIIDQRRRAWGLPPMRSFADYLLTDSPIVASDAALGALPPDTPSGIVQTGSLALAISGTLDPNLERFLGEGAPPVYVGFGSMPDPEPRRTTQMILDALAACGRRGLIGAGWAALGEANLPRSICVVPSVPHALLLPRVAVAVHHGGAGTTAAAARAGVPQIVVPHLADQFYWGHQIHARGLGSRPIRRTRLTAASLAHAIREVLASPAIVDRARDIRSRLEQTDGAGAVMALLNRTLADARAPRRAA